MKTITLKLDINEIVYDVQNKTYLTGRSRRDGTNHQQVASMQANDDDENSAQVLRSVTTAFAILRTKLAEYIEEGASTATNAPLETGSEMQLILTMPSNFNSGASATIGEAAHQFIVGMAIAEWFTITDKSDAADYMTMANESLKVIEEAINKRVRPVRC